MTTTYVLPRWQHHLRKLGYALFIPLYGGLGGGFVYGSFRLIYNLSVAPVPEWNKLPVAVFLALFGTVLLLNVLDIVLVILPSHSELSITPTHLVAADRLGFLRRSHRVRLHVLREWALLRMMGAAICPIRQRWRGWG